MSLKVIVTKSLSGAFIVTPIGQIDSETYIDLEVKLAPILIPSTKTIIFNMGQVDYISSMGINAIFKARHYLEKNGGSIMLADLQPQVKTIFDILKALKGTTVFESMEEMEAYIKAIQEKEKK